MSTSTVLPSRIPFDAFALKKIGVDVWQRSFFWPVSDETYGRIADGVVDRVASLLSSIDRDDANLLLCDASYSGFLIQHIQARVALALCQRNGIEAILGAAAEYVRPDWVALAKPFRPTERSIRRVTLEARKLAKRVAFSTKRGWSQSSVAAVAGRSPVWSIGTVGEILTSYVEERGLDSPSHHYAELLLDRRSDYCQDALGHLLDTGISEAMSSIEAHVDDETGVHLDLTEAFDCWRERLRAVSSLSNSLRKKITATHLLCNEPASLLHRTVSHAAISNGARVVAFAHGNDPGLLRNRMTPYVQWANCDEFVCPSRGAIELHRDMHVASGMVEARDVRFEKNSDTQFRRWHEAMAQQYHNGSVKSVMVIGFPMNPRRYVLSQGDFFVFQIELELQTIRALRTAGFTTIYKMHPERIAEARGIYESECDEIVVEPFERCWSKADAFVFSSVTSSTFGFAVCTPRPIAVVDLDGQRWNPRIIDSLSRRCSMIPARFGTGNRPKLETDALVSAMRTEKRRDDTYVRDFLYP